MTVLFVFKLDCDEDAVSKLQEGEHVIGRGALLQCDDKRVSRNHGLITITKNEATITSTHINPCFYQSASSKTITILTKDIPTHLGDGDKFALLADKFWYKIKLEDTKDVINGNSVADSPLNTTKRGVEDDRPASCKKLKIDMEETVNNENKDENDIKNVLDILKNETELSSNLENNEKNLNLPSTSSTTKKEAMSDSESDTSNEPKNETKQRTNSSDAVYDAKIKALLFSSDEEEEENSEIKNIQNSTSVSHIAVVTESDVKNNEEKDNDTKVNDRQNAGCSSTTDDTNKPGPSDTNKNKEYRYRCFYGLECYRKNKSHLSEYSHPGDSDYESDPSDDRPVCAFGAECYRLNKEHRKQYKHPRNMKKPPKIGKKNKPPTKKRAPRQQYNDSSEDDYDLEDPFIDDSGSEFAADSGSDDSDSDWSEGSEEETKRLLKEAKRFTRETKKKKDQQDD